MILRVPTSAFYYLSFCTITKSVFYKFHWLNSLFMISFMAAKIFTPTNHKIYQDTSDGEWFRIDAQQMKQK